MRIFDPFFFLRSANRSYFMGLELYNDRAERILYMERAFRSGDLVRHFKRETVDPSSDTYLYRIVGEAEHTETGEMLMVYQALYGDRRLYARPKAMFMEETDHVKYPDIRQKYRFEKVSEEE
jgi:hypothetical protein